MNLLSISSVKDNLKNKEIRKEYGYKRKVSFVQSEVTPDVLLDKLKHEHVFFHNFEPRKTGFRKRLNIWGNRKMQ